MAAASLSISTPIHVGLQNSTSPKLTMNFLSSPAKPTISILHPSRFLALQQNQNKKKSVLRIRAQVQEVLQNPSKQTQYEKKLYVGNIPRTVTNEELAKIFSECGTVEKAEVMYDKYTKKSRRFGFVTMSTVEDSQAAVEKMNGSEIGGRQIKVNATEKPLETSALDRLTEENFVDSSYKVYVGNLSKTVTIETLKKRFSDKVKVLDVKVVRNLETGKSLGYGFVSFSTQEDMETAITLMNDVDLEGKPIRVNAV